MAKLLVSGTTVKSWFQYRCERKTRYECMAPQDRMRIPILQDAEPSAWAQLGVDFEDRVLHRLRQQTAVFLPPPGFGSHDEDASEGFLSGSSQSEYGYQLTLRPVETLTTFLQLPPEVSLLRGKPDLVRIHEQERRTATIIDIKATQVATPFHKAQVAFYGLMLEALVAHHGFALSVSDTAEIWRIPDGGDASLGQWTSESFSLASYRELVIDFFRRNIPDLARVEVAPTVDRTFFHLYFKCEQCQYLRHHCIKSIQHEDPGRWDISAVPGLSHGAKAVLWRSGITKVADLAGRRLDDLRTANWTLRVRHQALSNRARALLDGSVRRAEGVYTVQMPPKVDVALVLSADRDPVQGNLATLGYLYRAEDHTKTIVRVLPVGSREAEAAALIDILGIVIQDLSAVDQWNKTDPEHPRTAHIYVYEPAEAAYLREALGRHLSSRAVCEGLLQLIRMFPPEEAVPEPEYKGVHHLPATAIRSVFEQLYALPATVSYDLLRVSQSLARLGYVSEPYCPPGEFERPFSSLLSIDLVRQLRLDPSVSDRVEHDVTSRLKATLALIDWITEQNAQAETPFLRLNKAPFRFQESVHPLNPGPLEFLQAQALLENRATMLATLARLGQPSNRRRDTLRCFADLTLRRSSLRGSSRHLSFAVPFESQYAELSGDTYAVILTNDDPDVLMSPLRWDQYRVAISSVTRDPEPMVSVRLPEDRFQAVFGEAVSSGSWFLDEVFVDPNTSRLLDFLNGLASMLTLR